MGTFPPIENPILRTVIFCSFFDLFYYIPKIRRSACFYIFRISETTQSPISGTPPERSGTSSCFWWVAQFFCYASVRAELSHFPSKNLSDSHFQPGGMGVIIISQKDIFYYFNTKCVFYVDIIEGSQGGESCQILPRLSGHPQKSITITSVLCEAVCKKSGAKSFCSPGSSEV